MLQVISGHLGWVRCVAFEPGNEWFVTGAGDRVIKVSSYNYKYNVCFRKRKPKMSGYKICEISFV